jgi:hypothetical protein
MRFGTRTLFVALALLAALAGCASDHDKAKKNWFLRIDEGAPRTNLPIERFDIFLPAGATQQETFELHGPAMMLAGAFPLDAKVGSDEKFDNLIGALIAVRAAGGGDPAAPQSSSITIGGTTYAVQSGDLEVERISGYTRGPNGDRSVWGKFTLRIAAPEGERQIRGTFAAQAVTSR